MKAMMKMKMIVMLDIVSHSIVRVQYDTHGHMLSQRIADVTDQIRVTNPRVTCCLVALMSVGVCDSMWMPCDPQHSNHRDRKHA